MPLFDRVQYLASAHSLAELPPDRGAEIAFVGRSNAGKSSAINALAHHTRLAFVSKTPGRTQLINFFSLGDPALGRALVDLPGYGYAKVPPKVKAHWEQVLAEFLATRQSLRGLVLIMDARHPLRDSDEAMLDWFGATGKPVHCLLTKADKLSRSEQALTLRSVKAQLQLKRRLATVQLFSSLKRTGVEEAEVAIGAILEGPEPTPQKEKGA